MRSRCAAVDIGAGSGRVIVGDLVGDKIELREAHRFTTPLLSAEGGEPARWDIDRIATEVETGLAAAEASEPGSVGVDTWGVDYVLLDADGRRLGPAVAYRDSRTEGMMETVFGRVPKAEIYRRTGIQFMAFNTLYQLAADARDTPERLRDAAHFLMIPDYLHYRLSGVIASEYTNATTTQLLNLETGDWDADLLAAAGVPAGLMRRPVEPGTILAEIRAPGGSRRSMRVVTPATHDTGSAVAAAPLAGPDEAYISSGTWSLMGVESFKPFADARAADLNISNEGGVDRRFRVLKNIMGLWLIQRVKAELNGPDHAELVSAAEVARPWRSIVDPADDVFLNPPSMIAAIRERCAATGQPAPEDAGELARCVFDSLALSYGRVLRELEALRGSPITHVRVVGGGSRNALLNQLCADVCGVPVSAGPIETTALGNVCVQMIASGALSGIDEARAVIRRSFPLTEFTPKQPVPESARHRVSAGS